MSEQAAPWFARRIRRGLAALVALRLEGHPAADMVEATAQVWVQALWPGRVWEETDAARIGEAFRQITLHETRWPAPAVFLRYLPARAPLAALPAPKMTQEEKEANKARVAEMMRALNERFAMKNAGGRGGGQGAMNRSTSPLRGSDAKRCFASPTQPGTQGDTDTTGG